MVYNTDRYEVSTWGRFKGLSKDIVIASCTYRGQRCNQVCLYLGYNYWKVMHTILELTLKRCCLDSIHFPLSRASKANIQVSALPSYVLSMGADTTRHLSYSNVA